MMMYHLAVFTEINALACLFFSRLGKSSSEIPEQTSQEVSHWFLSLALFFFLPCAHLSCFLFFLLTLFSFSFFFLCSLSQSFCIPILAQERLALGCGIQSQGSKATSHDRRKEDTLWPLSEMKLTSQASLPLSTCPFPPLNIDDITLAAC